MDSLADDRSSGLATQAEPTLVAWLDSVLRSDSPISIADDAPFLFRKSQRTIRRVLMSKGRPAAHAAAYEVTIELPDGRIRAAIIGAVATDPESRHKGFGSHVVNAITDDLVERGVSLAILWADVPKFYERLGFTLAGREIIFACPTDAWQKPKRVTTRRATENDIAGIRHLHERELCRVRRSERAWQTLFALPRTDFYVMEREARIIAYGVVGKGADLHGCLHEWGGEDLLLPALVAGISLERPERDLYVMAPPWKDQAIRAMAFHNIRPVTGSLAMMKVLDRAALLRNLGLADFATLPADEPSFVRALFGSPDDPAPAPGSRTPVPFYLFGLDSM